MCCLLLNIKHVQKVARVDESAGAILQIKYRLGFYVSLDGLESLEVTAMQ